MNMPKKYRMPPGMDEAMLVYETGFMPDELDKLPESMINNILIYKGMKERNR